MADEPSQGHLKAVAWRIRGRVQGVGFRWFTRHAASALGVDGWVRNLPDGSVEARARGSENALRQLEQQLRQGPAGAKVSQVDAQPLDPSTPMAQGFETRY